MPMTQSETIGFCSQTAQFLEDNKDNLQTLGLNVSNWGTEINTKRDLAIAKNGEQDDLKAQLKVKTGESKTAFKDAYNTASTRLDAAIGVLGKSTPLAKEAARLRSSINRKAKKETPTP
jgi:hypothetical protein